MGNNEHEITMEKVVSLCKRRGFVFQSSEIYGGQNGAWDYGSLGIELKRNISNAWWNAMCRMHDNIGRKYFDAPASLGSVWTRGKFHRPAC